jgi:hypothetical protein
LVVDLPKPIATPAYATGWAAFLEACAVAASIAVLTILAAFAVWRLVEHG